MSGLTCLYGYILVSCPACLIFISYNFMIMNVHVNNIDNNKISDMLIREA